MLRGHEEEVPCSEGRARDLCGIRGCAPQPGDAGAASVPCPLPLVSSSEDANASVPWKIQDAPRLGIPLG